MGVHGREGECKKYWGIFLPGKTSSAAMQVRLAVQEKGGEGALNAHLMFWTKRSSEMPLCVEVFSVLAKNSIRV